MAAERSKRRRLLNFRCRLFLSLQSRICQVSDCSPANRERELDLNRRETGWFYPTDDWSLRQQSGLVREEPPDRTLGTGLVGNDDGPKPPSVGLWLNASRPETRLRMQRYPYGLLVMRGDREP